MIAAYTAAAFVIVAFAVILSRLGLVEIAAEVAVISRQSLAVIRDKTMSDDGKEAAMQANTLALFSRFAKLTTGLVVALLAPAAMVWVVAFTGLYTFDQVIAVSLTWPFLIGGVAAFFVVLLLRKRA
jgi:sterol desaturase/sphingolipid hydroxylase (fatty acid hydroxylase superfamily)